MECSEGILIPFPFQTLKKERIRGKEVEDALYSKRPTIVNATTITSVVVVGTHLTFLALLPSLTRTPSQVKSMNPPVHVYTYFSFHPYFHQQQTFSACLCQTASPQTPLRPFQKLKRNCYCSTLLLRDLLCHVINKIFMHISIQQLLHIGLCNKKKE